MTGWSSLSLKQNGSAAVISVDDGKPTYVRRFNPWGNNKGAYPISADVDSSDLLVVGLTPYSAPGWGAMRLTADLRLDKSYAGTATRSTNAAATRARWSADAGWARPRRGTTGTGTAARSSSRFGPNGAGTPTPHSSGRGRPSTARRNGQAAAIDSSGRLVIAGQGKNRTRDAIIGRLTLT